MLRTSAPLIGALGGLELRRTMTSTGLFLPMAAHVLWAGVLYAALTVARAPSVWGVGATPDGKNPFAEVEPRISANLKNQFEWPVLFYLVCLLAMQLGPLISQRLVWLAWLFVAGRVAHSTVQVLTTNVRLRGIVFTINFLAVFAMWGTLVMSVESG